VHTILNQSLNQAVVRKKIKDNPAKGLAPANKKDKAYKKWVVLDGDQLASFLESIEDHRDYFVILTAAYTGARQSELLGLTWDTLLEAESSLRIDKALHKTYEEEEDKFEYRDRTKNEPSTRTIGISQKLIFALNSHREKQKEKGISIDPEKLIFTESDGGPMDADNLSSRYRKLVKRHGHKGMTFHHLRHTHATILLSDGAYINEVSQRLGHADPRVTLSTYGHVLPKRKHSLADRFDSLLAGTDKSEDKKDNPEG
jgi:integrase